MSFFKLLKSSFIKPTQNLKAKDMSFWQVLLYLIILNCILMVPLITKAFNLREMATNDLSKAQQNINNFSIKNGEIQTDAKKGTIYNGELITVTFDPYDKQSQSEMIANLHSNLFGLSFEKSKLRLGANEMIANFLPSSNPITLSYKDLGFTNISKKNLFNKFESLIFNSSFISLFLIICFVMTLFSLLVNLIIVTFAALLYSKMSKLTLKFGEIFKICIALAPIATIIEALLQIIISAPNAATISLIIILFLFFQTVKPLQKNKQL